MSQFLFLDSGPLGLLTHPRQTEEVVAITTWLSQVLRQGHRILVPAVVYYELKRELLRADKPFSIGRLDLFTKASNRYVPLTDEALRLAAELWAKARQLGRPTADSKELNMTSFSPRRLFFWSRSRRSRGRYDEFEAPLPVHHRKALGRDSSLNLIRGSMVFAEAAIRRSQSRTSPVTPRDRTQNVRSPWRNSLTP